MNILVINTFDQAGGAEKVAFDLCRLYADQGHDVRLLVKNRRTTVNSVIEGNVYAHTMPWSGVCHVLENQVRALPRFRGQYRLADAFRVAAFPQRLRDQYRGVEDFNYPYSHDLLHDTCWQPDVVHAHNLHGNYFDLRALAALSRQIPLIWTLHDTWALTGHCGHFEDIGCERWRSGCGHCPDLQRPPSIRRDQTAANWQRKREIYSQSQLAIATPSQWLLEYVNQSIIQPRWARVIHNGIDLSIFRPGDRTAARATLGLPQDAFICTFAAQSGGGNNPYKDYTTVTQAVEGITAARPEKQIVFVCIGGDAANMAASNHHYTGYISDPQRMALYYQASDVLLHAANIENFPCVILEASACGTPVIATSVGGIPEILLDGDNGFLVPRRDSNAMKQKLLYLIDHPQLATAMGERASRNIQQHFSLETQVSQYLGWFDELVSIYEAAHG